MRELNAATERFVSAVSFANLRANDPECFYELLVFDCNWHLAQRCTAEDRLELNGDGGNPTVRQRMHDEAALQASLPSFRRRRSPIFRSLRAASEHDRAA
jgi:hypothetical protein